MQYLKYEGTFNNPDLVEKLDSRETGRKVRNSLLTKTMEFNQKQYPNAFVFISCMYEDCIEGGIIADSFLNPKKLLSKFFSAIEIAADDNKG